MSVTCSSECVARTRAHCSWAAVAMVLLLTTTGCANAPSFNILGSYFPSWIVCCAGAAIVTFAAHRAFVRWNLLGELWPLPLVYTALFSFASCTFWLLFFN